MKEEDAFVQAILSSPEEESLRLIYADWLEERGDPRGEFLQLDTALAGMPKKDKTRPKLEQRLAELRKVIDLKWIKIITFRPINTIEDLVEFLREFHRPWMALSTGKRRKIPADLPYGLALIYRELGALFEIDDDRAPNHRRPFNAQDALVPVNRLKRIKGMVEFAWENQGNWSCRCPLGQEDPPVYSNAADLWEEGPAGFQKVCDSLNRFLITLSLQEAVMSAPCLVAAAGKSPEKILKVACRPLWINGVYVQGKPTHDFFAIPEEDVLIMDGAGVWLGSHTDAAMRVVKAGVKPNRLY